MMAHSIILWFEQHPKYHWTILTPNLTHLPPPQIHSKNKNNNIHKGEAHESDGQMNIGEYKFAAHEYY